MEGDLFELANTGVVAAGCGDWLDINGFELTNTGVTAAAAG